MINTLEGLVDYINGEDFNMLVVNKIIEENGWRDTSGISDYDVCQSGSRKVVLDDNTGEAKIVSMDTMWFLGKAVAIIEHVCKSHEGFPQSFQTVCAPPKKTQSFMYWCREALKSDEELLLFVNELDYQNLVMSDPLGRYWVGYYQTKCDLSKSDERTKIGNAVRKLREKKGYSLRKLSELSGVSYQNITKIEHGRYNVSVDILGKLATVLDASIKFE